MIYTSYFANVKSLPSEVVPIAICGGVPEWWCGLQYRKLAPKREFFNEWKSSGDNDYYVKCYYEQVLSHLDPAQVYNELYKLVEYTGTVAYFVIPMVGVGTGKVVLVYVDEADVVGLNTTFEELEKFWGLPVALCSCNDTMEYLCTSTLKEKYRIEEF